MTSPTVPHLDISPDGGSPLPLLPPVARTRDGQEVCPADDVWSLRKRSDGGGVLRFDWRQLRGLSARMAHLAKVMFAARLANYATTSSAGQFDSLRRLGAWHQATRAVGATDLEWAQVDLAMGERWLEHEMLSADAGNVFSRIRCLYRYGVEALRHPDFSPAILLALETVRAPGNLKGNAVRNGDPVKGYFTPPEVDLILEALGKDAGTCEQRASVWLCLELGRNSLQYTLLTNADLTRVSVIDAGATKHLYQVRARRIKKRAVVDSKMPWPISSELGDLLWSLRRGTTADPLLWWLDPTQPEQDLNATLRKWAKAAKLISPRTGRGLHLNPRRFRVTMMTNAADEGASAEHLAMLADHTDLQNVQVYIDRSPLFLDRIRDKVDAIYDPIVRRFKGTFTTAETALDTGARVIPGLAPQLPLLNVGGIGACGRSDLCRLAPPLTCYQCPFFVAFRDGPHAQVIAALEQTMAGMNERMALQLAGTLAAAREVVARIASESTAGVAA